MAFLDGTVVNVALPVMQKQLGITVNLAQWVVEAYSLFLASLVLVGGALGDHLGRRRVFSAGVVVFADSGVASGINNAVARAAGLLAIAALGLVVVARFNRVLDGELAAASLSEVASRVVEQQRGKLVGADLSELADTGVRATLRRAFADAYVAGFRAAMLVSASLGLLGAICALALVQSKPERFDPSVRVKGIGGIR
jgi:MFS family permease